MISRVPCPTQLSFVSLSLLFVLIVSLTTAPEAYAKDPTTIKLGAIFSLSSWGAMGGQGELQGVLLAKEEINASGGIKGRPLEVLVEDNQSDLRITASVFNKLASIHKVSAVIGPNWVEFFEVAAPLAMSLKTPTLSASGGKPPTSETPWAFTLWPPAENATRVLAHRLISDNKNRIALLVMQNAYYQGLAEALTQQLSAAGVQLALRENFNPAHTDYRSTLSKLKRDSFDAVVVFLGEGGELAAFLKQRNDLSFTTPLYAANTLPFDPILQKDLSLAEGLVYFDYVLLGDADFKKRYMSRFKEEPGFGSAKAYDAVKAVSSSILVCGEAREDIRRCLATQEFKGSSGRISFSSDGVIKERADNTILYSVRSGRVTTIPTTKHRD